MCEHHLCNSVATKEVIDNNDDGVFYGVLCDYHTEIAVRQGAVETDESGAFRNAQQIMFNSYLDAYAHVERCAMRQGSRFQ